MKRVLITGATGFLGGHLATHLRAKGFEIVATGRNERKLAKLQAQGFSAFQHDFSLSVPHCDPVDAIVHCAALSSPFGRLKEFQRANVKATRNVVKLAHKMRVARVVNISSPTLYFAFKDTISITENAPLPPPINHYARTKAIAENLMMAAPEVGCVNLRPRGLYGTGDTSLLPRILHAAKRGPLPVFRHGLASIDLTHVQDVCRAIEAALLANNSAVGQTFNISGGEPLPIRKIVDTVCTQLGVSVRWRKTPLLPARALARALELSAAMIPHMKEPRVTAYTLGLFAFQQSLNIEKAKNLLGWEPQVRFAEGLGLTLGPRQ